MGPLTWCLLQLLAALFLLATVGTARRASYGNPCSPEVRCDSRKFLACSPRGICDCLMPTSMIFDDILKQCATLAGERCENSTAGLDHPRVACATNATCKNGMCECGPDHYELSNGTCPEKLSHGEDCASDDMCKENQHLVCGVTQKCSCRQNRVFSESYGECVLRAGEVCTPSKKCTDNSHCDKHCTCEEEFYPSDHGTCEMKPSAGQPCLPTGQCREKVELPQRPGLVPSLMKCIGGTCACDPQVATHFSPEFPGNSSCGRKLNSACSQREKNNCIQGAICDSAASTCQCDPWTHFPGEGDICEPRLLHGQPCSERSPCNYYEKRLNCSATTNTCVCTEGSVIDPDSQECRGSPGTRCYFYSSRLSCVPNAACRKFSDNCECSGEFAPSALQNDYCYVPEGESCYGDSNEPITTRTCLPGLLCSSRTCSCPYKDFQTYNVTREKCLSNLQGPCNTTEDCDVANSECGTQGDSGDLLLCRCKDGFIAARGACQLAFGETCNKTGEGRADQDICDTVAPLECSCRGICECVKQQVYDNQTNTCRGLVGAKCDLQWKSREVEGPRGFCVEGAFCKRFRGYEEQVGSCKCDRGWTAEQDGTCKLGRASEIKTRNAVGIRSILDSDNDTSVAESSSEMRM